MATLTKRKTIHDRKCFYVVHPLDDHSELKRSADNLGPMTMTPAVRWSLIALRGYLVLMGFLVSYQMLNLVGFFGHHLKQ